MEVSIKAEPEWMIDDDGYINSQYYKDEQQTHAIAEYEIKPYYIPETQYHFEDLSCKVRNHFLYLYIQYNTHI